MHPRAQRRRLVPPLLLGLAWLVASTAPLRAQTDDPEPPLPPASEPFEPQPDEPTLIPTAPEDPLVVNPSGTAPAPSEPGLMSHLGDRLRPEPGRLLREGTVLASRRGRVVPIEGGWCVYVFDADAQGQAEPPMILLPSARLAEIRRAAVSSAKTLTFQISGSVTASGGRNYLLPTFFTTIVTDAPAAVPPPSAPGAAERPGSAAPGQNDPAVEDLLRQMELEDRRPSRTGAAPGGAAPGGGVGAGEGGGGGEPQGMLREGLVLASKRGRVDRAGLGLVFTTDAGAGEGERPMPPLILLPCLATDEIERLVDQRRGSVLFVLSGQVYAYDGRNYLLPTMVVLERDREGNLIPGH